MAPKYAKDQPAGFVNRIERVAIVGVSRQPTSNTISHLIKTLVAYIRYLLFRQADGLAGGLLKPSSRRASIP